MATSAWVDIASSETTKIDRFVQIVSKMDGRYAEIKTDQVALWLKRGDTANPYKDDIVEAFGWFADGTMTDDLSKMEAVILARFENRSGSLHRGHLLIIGWECPTNLNPEQRAARITSIVDDTITKGLQRLTSIDSAGVLKQRIHAIRPKSMDSRPMKELHDRVYNLTVPGSASRIRMINEHDLGDAVHWVIRLDH